MESPRDESLEEEAARRIVELSVDDAAERARAIASFEAWKQADPRHAEVAARMETLVERMQRVRAHGTARPACVALDAALAPRRRQGRARRLAAAAAAVCVLAVPVWFALEAYPPSYLLADIRAGTGQWQSHTLADGTRLTLSGSSAVNLRFDEAGRVVELVRGEILVDVAPDAKRPFTVATGHGRVRALGTRFLVSTEPQGSELTMLESTVAVYAGAREGGPDAVLRAGQHVRFTSSGLGAVAGVDAEGIEVAWRNRHLVVQEQPLPEVLEQLSRYRRGRIHFDRAQLQDIRVSAVLPLDDPDRALQLLVNSFPTLRVRNLTPWLVLVDTAGSS